MQSDEIETLAKLKFNLSTLKPFQQAIIKDFLQGHDVLVISPTGSGKSLCYQLPALIMPGTFIIISPLIALMQDQIQKLKQREIEAECLHADLPRETQQQILHQVKNQAIKLLYVSPERLLQPMFLSFLKQLTISGFAIDEVHCMLQWGHDFRPEYQGLAKLKQWFPKIPIMALTATANPKNQKKIIEQLQLKAQKHIQSIHRSNIEFCIVDKTRSTLKLEDLCQRHLHQSGIIYSASRQKVDSVFQRLKNEGYPVLRYHAGMPAEEKSQQLKEFLSQEEHIMVATMAFGMGVDKPNLRFVVHMDVPGRLDQFIQEAGRIGRDGHQAHSYLVFHPGQYLQLNLWRLQKVHPNLFVEELDDFQKMTAFLHSRQCYTTLIHEYFGQSAIPACLRCQRCQTSPHSSHHPEDMLKLLSCIYRLQDASQHARLMEVMLGKQNARTKSFENLSTFGIGKHRPLIYWQHALTALLANQDIRLSCQTSLAWQLTPKALSALKSRTYQDNDCYQPI